LFSKLRKNLFYGWVMVASFFVAGIVLWGVRFSFGVFFKSIESEFALTRATTSAVMSAYMALGSLFAIIGGWALDRYGPRIVFLIMGVFTGLSLLLTSQVNSVWQLFLTYSLLLAMGTSSMYTITMSTVSRWFDRKRGLALGIGGSGAGLGMVVMAPFATYLITNLDWRMAYLIIGLLAWALVIPISRLLKRDPYEIGVLPDGVKSAAREAAGQPHGTGGLSVPQVLKTRSFWVIIFTWVLFASCLFLINTHIVPHAQDKGFTAGEAAVVLSLIGVALMLGRVVLGVLSDRIGRKRTATICALCMAGMMLWLLWADELWMLYLFALVFGFAYGGMGPSMAALVGDTFGLQRIGAILGVLDVGFGTGAAIGPAIGGLVFDTSNSYYPAFIYGIAAMLAVALLIGLIRREVGRES
jgi:MFS family permease